MSQRTSILTAMLLIPIFAVAGAALAGEDGTATKKIKIKKHRTCEGEGCEEGASVVFVGKDGVMEVHGEGLDWIGPGGHGHLRHFAGHGMKGGYLGIGLTDLTPELRRHFGVPEDAGVMVAKVIEGSAAETAGVRVGDVVTAVDGEEVASGTALAHTIRGRESGESVNLEVWRDGKVQILAATLDERQPPRGHRHARVIRVECEEGEDCDFDVDPEALGCEEGACEVEVICRNGECSCQVNGEAHDCAGIDGIGAQPG